MSHSTRAPFTLQFYLLNHETTVIRSRQDEGRGVPLKVVATALGDAGERYRRCSSSWGKQTLECEIIQ